MHTRPAAAVITRLTRKSQPLAMISKIMKPKQLHAQSTAGMHTRPAAAVTTRLTKRYRHLAINLPRQLRKIESIQHVLMTAAATVWSTVQYVKLSSAVRKRL